jgi:RNA polymerase sigma-70 factor (ECF subfamily)
MRDGSEQDARYTQAAAEFGGALQRLARATEADPERRRDLLQDMHVALWRSFAAFDGRCSLRTWTYRVAHNAAASYVDKERRVVRASLPLDEVEHVPAAADTGAEAEANSAIERLIALIRQLKPADRQIITLYLEGLDAASIAEVAGLSPAAVAKRVSRAKTQLNRLFQGAADAGS